MPVRPPLVVDEGRVLSGGGARVPPGGLLLEGVLRICYYNKQGDEVTRNFIDELHLTTDLRGLEYGLASPEYVQAVTDCRLLVWAKRDWEELAHTIGAGAKWDTK